MDLEFKPTKEQEAAIKAPIDKPLKVFAGAGTGKTAVLKERYLYLIRDKGFKPEQVLALTFTKKAAGELRDRVRKAFDDPLMASRAEIWNFDAFWWHLLLENPHQSGIEDSWRVADPTEIDLLQDDIVATVFRNEEFRNLAQSLTAIEKTELRKILYDGFARISYLKCRLVDEDAFEIELERLWSAKRGDFSEPDNQRAREAVSVFKHLYQFYQGYFDQHQLLDFGDVLIRTYRMLSDHPGLSEYYRNRYRYILIDETQDTNPAQFEILKFLAEPQCRNVTMVGDDKQAIYGFRGASPKKFQEFVADEARLSENHRSPNEILELATELICQDAGWKEQRKRIVLKNLKAPRAEQPIIFIHCAQTKQEEARAVAARVHALISSGISPNSIALLFRGGTHLGTFEAELSRWGIPFRSVGGGFYQRPEIKDALALLKFLTHPEELKWLVRLLERPPLSLGVQELQQMIGAEASDTQSDLREAVDILKSRLGEVEALAQRIALPELLYQAMVHSGVLAAGCLDPQFGERIRRNCAKLLRLAMPWTSQIKENPLEFFIRLLEHQIVMVGEEDEEPGEEDCVQLLTIHRAKGLEFDHVFWCDVRDTRKGSAGSLTVDIELDDIKDGERVFSGMGLIIKPLAQHTETNNRLQMFNTETKSKQTISEEIRLQYVAVTRAKKTLTITCSQSRNKAPGLYEIIQNLAAGNPAYQEGWEIPEVQGKLTAVGSSTMPDSQDYWIPRLQPLATALRRRLDANFAPCDPLVLSFADLERYRECPRLLLWSLIGRKVDKQEEENPQPEEVTWGESGMEFGLVAHRLLKDMTLFPECVNHLTGYISEEHLPDASGARVRLHQIIRNYENLGFSKTEDIRTEVPWALPFKINGNNVVVRGRVDRIHQDRHGWVLLDYKTGKVNDEFRDSYFRQLNLYRLAAETGLFPGVISPRIVLVEIETGSVIDIPPDATVKQTILEVGNAVFSRNFPTAESAERCQSCPYRSENPAGTQPCDPLTYEGYHG
jgi:DNA helicase-2/ATP-dependent DNA helicase PcrA